jgi:hypothetical protein
MKNGNPIRRRRLRRGGTAVVEFVVCIPLLALVLVATFFFGWAMTNQQHVWGVDRYVAWRQVRTGMRPSDPQLNQTYFAGRASNFGTSWDGGDLRTQQEFVSEASGHSATAGDFAQTELMTQWPRDVRVSVHAEFPTSVAYWNKFTGAISSRHARGGLEWRWKQAACEAPVADRMFTSLDGLLTTVPAPANGLGTFFAGLYREGWQYHNY